MADATDNQWVNCFQEQGEAILGEKADELGAMQERDKDTYDKIFAQAAFKRYNLRLRCKADTYNDEQRVRHTIVSATPINFMEYNKKMIQDLESAGIPLPTGINRDKYMN
jgi:replication factor A1